MITAELVQRRIANFWGYGSFEAPVWFVGMEEGLGPETELEERFRASDGKATIDIRRDMVRVPYHMRWFRPPTPPIQQTWRNPTALYLFLKSGTRPCREELRIYQRDVLGDVDRKDLCVIDVMPLPARSTKNADWLYLSFVGSRRQYLGRYKPERVRQLGTLIKTHRPRLLIFHSLKYLSNGSASCVIPHANSRGLSYDRLYGFAACVRSQGSMT